MIRVFPRRTHWTPTDALAFYGPPPMFRPGDRSTPVHISVAFTWDKPRAEYLYKQWSPFYDDVQIGGPAYLNSVGEFTPGLYLKEGCTITSRGCPKDCWWCGVPTSEGKLFSIQIKPGWIVQDNNLLACPDSHVREVFAMLREQDRAIFFNGGLDKHYFKPWHRELFDSIKIGELWFACDQFVDIAALERITPLLDGISVRKRRCYTMIGGRGETIEQADYRLNRVLELGFMPFCQLYQEDRFKIYPPEWRALQRKWSRPAAYMGTAHESPQEVLDFSGVSE